MNIENLKVGTIKNYKELCRMLEIIPATNTTHRKRQLEDLERFCTYHKDGNKIIIDEVFQEPKEKLGTGLYKEDIELLLLDLLARNKDNNYQISLTIKNILRALEMVNDNFVNNYSYTDENKKYLHLSEAINVKPDIIGDVFFLVKDKNKRNLQSALKDLADKSLILWELRLNVCRRVIEYKYNDDGDIIIQEDGQPWILDSYEQYDYATDKEKQWILKAEKDAMKEMNVKKKTFFNINKDARKIFEKAVASKLIEYNIKFYYYTYDITYNKEEILEELGRIKIAEVRNRLNKNILEQIEKTIESCGKRVKDKYSKAWGLLPPSATDQEHTRIKKAYEKDGKKTAKAIIDRKTRVKTK